MKKHIKIWLGVLLLAALIVAVTAWYLSRHGVAVLQPAGEISAKERNLIILCSVLSGTVVLPVFGLLGYFAWKYREGNKSAEYRPDEHGNNLIETIWWVIPTLLLIVISVITWRSSYALDPFKPLASHKKPVHIQVVAMDWKWLFIYPGSKVASLNEVAIPVDAPVTFDITSDTVMSSFWVPKLGGQMYAMPGMSTALNLKATKIGDYRGVSANIGGKGFADMHFTVRAVSDTDYQKWLATVGRSKTKLTDASYAELAKQKVQKDVVYYSTAPHGLYGTIIMKYMMPMGDKTHTEGS